MTLKRRAGQLVRELASLAEIVYHRGGTHVMFFPSSGRERSSLLRAYNIAQALNTNGWAAVVVPAQLTQKQRLRLMALFKPNIVVLQQGRHPLNDAALFGNIPFVYDIDDADCLDPRCIAREEALATAARGVMAGSSYIADWYARFNPQVATIWTGGPIRSGSRPRHCTRPTIVTWAQSEPMRYPREFDFVEAVALRVRERRGQMRLRLYGWREAFDHPRLTSLREGGVELELMRPIKYRDFVASLEDCAIGLSPVMVENKFSRGKSFGKILAYLDAKVPVICSDQVDHGAFFKAGSGVVSNDPLVWVNEIDHLLDNPERRDATADAAFSSYCADLSTEAAAEKVSAFLHRTLPTQLPPRSA